MSRPTTPRETRHDYKTALADLRLWRERVGKNLYRHRSRQNIALHRLALLTNIAPERLDRFERGHDEIRLEQIIRLAVVLKVSLAELMP